MKLLYITRKFPPAVGGMEKVSYELSSELSRQIPAVVIAWGKSQALLPFFILKVVVQSLYLIPANGITHIHLADGVLAPLGVLFKGLIHRPVSITIHGLDITYSNGFYQWLIPRSVAKLDNVICISQATKIECLSRHIPENRISVIPWGVDPDEFKLQATRADLEHLIGRTLKGKKILITIGRLVKRKGVAWFINEVMPQLPTEFVYLVVGSGPERAVIEAAIAEHSLQDRVFFLGRVSDFDLKVIYSTADVFVMPNIPIPGDIEGFGIVALEAGSSGLPVVAAKIDGIIDAVLHGQTGELVEPGDAPAFAGAIPRAISLNKRSVSSSTASHFSWPKIAKLYRETLV